MHHVGLPEFVVESLGHGGIARRARLIEENSPRLCHSQGLESRFGTGSRRRLQRQKDPLDAHRLTGAGLFVERHDPLGVHR